MNTLPSQSSLLGKRLLPGITVATLVLIAVMALSAILHFINIDHIGDANAYYTAAVKSMLQSWSNFFFVAAEPGGSVTVDKPPLGLWIEATFAYFLGVSGFSVSLPNILAGIFGVPLLYAMVRKYMGELAGLVAALVMALTPVFVATNRNNTMDGMLVFFLLLAAWAFIKATESGKLGWLLLGAFIVGLGFNIKMLQALLPLPAFYALYFFGSKEGWWRKVANLGIATILLLAVSLFWAIAVDLTPADLRPYIGSSRDNTVMGLITGHNGTSRLFGGFFGRNILNAIRADGPAPAQGGQGNVPAQGTPSLVPPNGQIPQQGGNLGGPPQQALDACKGETLNATCSFNLPNGANIAGTCITPPNSSQLACAPQGGPATQNGQIPPQDGNVGRPPRQALAACENQSLGAACSFDLPNGGNITGTCITLPKLSQLACAPQGQGGQPALNGQTPPQGGNAGGPPQQVFDACANLTQNASCSFNLPNGANVTGTCVTPPNSSQLACVPQGMIPQNGQVSLGGPNRQGGTPFSNETGTPGVLRFFTQPLSKQMSWLLPFALISLALLAFSSRIRLPLESEAHKALVLWGGWLVTCLVFFSAISGIFHSYYAIMLAPPLGAVVGMGFAQLWDWGKNRRWVGALLVIAAVVTVAFQAFAFKQYGESMIWIAIAGVTLLIGSILLVSPMTRRVAYVTILIAMLIAPAYWTTMTVASNGNRNLPTANSGTQQFGPGPVNDPRGEGQPAPDITELLTYLETNTQGIKYLVAVPSAQIGAGMVLATGRPVLYMGGFTGQDEVVTTDDLTRIVTNGELRYVLYGNASGKPEIANWLQASCSVVPEFSQQKNQVSFPPDPGNQAMTLYQCSK